MRREKIKDKLTVVQQEKIDDEEQRIAKAVAERDAKEAEQLWKEEEEKAAMLKSIIAHRELLVNCFKVLCVVIYVGFYHTFNTNCVSSETRKGAEGQNGKTEQPRNAPGQERSRQNLF